MIRAALGANGVDSAWRDRPSRPSGRGSKHARATCYRSTADDAETCMNAEHSVQSIIGATHRRQGLSW